MRKTFFLFALLALSIGAWAQSPVAINGRLQVKGTKLCNKDGDPVQLKGMSSHGLQWTNNCLKKSSIAALRNDWKSDLFRISMYVEENGYNTDTARFIAKVDSLVGWCTELGLYAIIDWHILTPGDPLHPSYKGAFKFFSLMAKRYGKKENILFELCNEPNKDTATWARIKEYAVPIIKEIRKYSQNIIIVGTPTWSQEIYYPANDPLEGTNLMYTFHFYSSTHGQLQPMFEQVITQTPVFVTEWGPTASDGNTMFDSVMASSWTKIMNENQISWAVWSFSDLPLTTSVLKQGSCTDNAWNNTTAEGTYIKRQIKSAKKVIKDSDFRIDDSLFYGYGFSDSIILNAHHEIFIKGLMNEKEFTVSVNGEMVQVLSTSKGQQRYIILHIAHFIVPKDSIRVSYTGNGSITNYWGGKLKKCDTLLIQTSNYPINNFLPIGTGFYTNFDNTKTLLPLIVPSGVTAQLEGNVLKIQGLGHDSWPGTYFRIPTSNISKNLKVTLSIKSSTADSIWINYSDTLNNYSDPYGPMKILIADNKYHDYTFDCSRISNKTTNKTCIKSVSLFINPTRNHTGTLYVNKLWVGDSTVFAPTTGVRLLSRTLSLKAEESAKIAVDYSPSNVLVTESWTSLNTAVASVSPKGVVTGIAEGSTKVVAYWLVNNKRITDTCVVTVNNGGEIKRANLLRNIAVADSILKVAKSVGTGVTYSATNIGTLAKEIETANKVAASNTASQKAIDSMVVVLDNSMAELHKTSAMIDYSALLYSLDKAAFIARGTKTGTRAGEYASEMALNLKTVCQSATALLTSNPSQHKADSAKQAVDAAIDAFKKSKIAQTANYRALDSLLVIAQKIYDTTKASKYAKADYDLFSSGIDNALQVDYYFGSTQTEIDKAQYELQQSIDRFKAAKTVDLASTASSNAPSVVHAYPNPLANQLTVQTTEEGLKKLEITTLLGQTVYETMFSDLELSVQCNEFATGVYLLKITNSKGQQSVLQLVK